MVRLYTDHPRYQNDIADELRLFEGREDIVPGDADECDVSVTLKEENGVWHARARVSLFSDTSEYEYTRPAVKGGLIDITRNEKRAMKIAVFRALRAGTGFAPPWGSLTGIRPTRLLRELMQSSGEAEAIRMMADDFDVSPEKLDLARQIVAVQGPIIASQAATDADVYVNIPFCTTKCLYCSFPSAVRTAKTDMDGYIAALIRDINEGAKVIEESGRRVRAMYMGGGTPTVLSESELQRVLDALHAAYPDFCGEFTVEAGRPDTINAGKLAVMRRAGVTRISVNPQSMNAETLALIGRSHAPEDVERAFLEAREAGFDNINMDIIAGLPGEGIPQMENTLVRIARLKPESLTVHTLALKRTSRLVTEPSVYPMPDAETAEKMVAMGAETAQGLNMKPYYMYRQKYMSGNLENVGYAVPGCECVYNVDMMEDTTPIMAHGAGSMTKCVYDAERRVERVPSPKDIKTYAAKIEILTADKRKLFC